MNKYYKLSIRTADEQRIEVVVEAENLLNLISDLKSKGEHYTFISKKNPDRESFTIFKHDIKKIDYQVVPNVMFDRLSVFIII